MDLVINQVVQFQHVDIPNCHRTVEVFTGTAINQTHLTGG
jgi:hypothetical protein